MSTDAWQPIETAPRDGTPVLIYGPLEVFDNSRPAQIGVACCCEATGFWICASGNDAIYQPTHWRPLPPQPQDISSGTGKNVTS